MSGVGGGGAYGVLARYGNGYKPNTPATTNRQNTWDWLKGGGANALWGPNAWIESARPIDEGQVAFDREMAMKKADWEREDYLRLTAEPKNRERMDLAMSYMRDLLGMGDSSPLPGVNGGDADYTAKNAAAFGRAKDQTSQAYAAARRRLGANMAERGIAGSGIEQELDTNNALATAGGLGEASRRIAETTADRAAQVADRNYQGAVTMRGQDAQRKSQVLSMFPAFMSLLSRSSY